MPTGSCDTSSVRDDATITVRPCMSMIVARVISASPASVIDVDAGFGARTSVDADDDSTGGHVDYYNDNGDDDATRKENLALVKVAIDCTLHQLLVTGTLHGEVETSLFYFCESFHDVSLIC